MPEQKPLTTEARAIQAVEELATKTLLMEQRLAEMAASRLAIANERDAVLRRFEDLEAFVLDGFPTREVPPAVISPEPPLSELFDDPNEDFTL